MRIQTLAVLAALTAFALVGSIDPGVEVNKPELGATSVNTGPYAGVVESGETNDHHYQNAPDGWNCIALAQPYSVVMEYLPNDATVTLSAGGYTTTSTGGLATLNFWKGVCTKFTIEVSTDDGPVAYAIEVRGGPASAGGGNPTGAIAA